GNGTTDSNRDGSNGTAENGGNGTTGGTGNGTAGTSGAGTGSTGGDNNGAGTGSGGNPTKVVVRVTVPISTLMGLDDQPGDLAGYGPIPAAVARDIAAGGTWKRLLTDPVSGMLLDYGRT